jgi:hypothetical protein
MKHVRPVLLLILMTVAGFLIGRRRGYQEAAVLAVGGGGNARAAVAEWQEGQPPHAAVYINDGVNGFAFDLEIDPNARMFMHTTKVFVCQNDNPGAVRIALDLVRQRARTNPEGGDSSIRQRSGAQGLKDSPSDGND